ncbi:MULTISPECIES: relaxase/mobilization nuclease domain-containing protein [unclassified Candidatus Paralachnospira]|uniref:relaxase/mobilization nuclease domain-containing protein n=1 Tax=unclassified Candidatus Paralachnospira TaxID=3099471 RepID=UPI003F8E2074
MAVTGFWPIYKNLKATLDYADNPDKTTDRRYLDDDLYAALSYAENDSKTDRKMYVSGINCSKQNAYAEMVAVQRRFGMRGKVVGYHGIQSFAAGEVTPEQAFEIGKVTARKMWGDRYQVLVTVHLNTDNVHCHFVVNPVSYKDGVKFKNKIGDHKELRRVSDEICREHGLSVLENSNFYGGHKKDYWRHKSGKKTHRDYLREDVEYCLSFATSPREFENQLYALGYTLDPVRFSVKAKHWERSVRLANIGFTKEIVQAQLDRNAENRYHLFTLEYRPPYRPKKFPLEDELRKLEFSIDHCYDAATVFVDTIFYIIITVIQIAAELADVMLLSPDLRAAEKDLKELISDYHFLKENDIHTVADLQANIDESKAQLSDLERERKTLSNRIRRPKSLEDESQNKESRKAISKQMKPVREKLRRAEKILEKSPHLYELLKQECELERKARARYLDRSR